VQCPRHDVDLHLWKRVQRSCAAGVVQYAALNEGCLHQVAFVVCCITV
jgi:hypothetical protein